MSDERAIFIGFEVLGGGTVAKFQGLDDSGISRLDRISCEIRLRNLASRGEAYDKTLIAVRGFANFGRVFDEGECLCPLYGDHDGKCGDGGCDCHEVTRSDVL